MFRFVAIVMAFLFGTSLAQADDRVGSFVVFDDVQDAIFLNGEITVGTPLDMRRALALRPAAKFLVLASPGGLVASALIVADDVNRLGLSTFIPEGLGCYSACAFIFLAGHGRIASGELGVHQMASEIPDPSGVQYSTADILDALGSYGVPAEVITRMLRTPNESMYVFTAAEVEALGINRTVNAATVLPDSRLTAPPTATPSAPTSGGTKLALYGGLDFYGGDIASLRTPDAVQCATACMDDRICRAFTYNANPKLKKGPNCFLKSGTDRPEAYDDAISGVLLGEAEAPIFEVGSGELELVRGFDLLGGDIMSRPLSGARSLESCRAACAGNRSCEAFSFAVRQRQCWLKDELGPRESNPNIISGIKRGTTYRAERIIPLE